MPVLDTHTLVDCECKAKVYSDGSGVDIEYCNLHRFAPEMYAALLAVDNIIEHEMFTDGFEIQLNSWIKNVLWPLSTKVEQK